MASLGLEKGAVEGRIYKNPSVGLELTPAPTLRFGIPKLNGSPARVVSVDAWDYSLSEGMSFSADILSYHPKNQRSTKALMQSLVETVRHGGYEPTNVRTEGTLDGVEFARIDFEKVGNPGGRWTYEAAFVRACATKELIFLFIGPDQESVKKLIGGTVVKLDLAISRCRSKAEDVSTE
jgi:hypothetical protein